MRGIIRDKSTISTHAVRRTELLVDMFFGTGSRKIPVFKRALFPRMAFERMAHATRVCEGATVRRNAHYDFVRWHSLSHHVRHSRVTGNGSLGTVWDLWSEQLGLVAGFRNPRTGVIVRHQVDHVQVLCSVS